MFWPKRSWFIVKQSKFIALKYEKSIRNFLHRLQDPSFCEFELLENEEMSIEKRLQTEWR